jgi:hypothetical protein
MAKKILSVGFEIPGDQAEYVSLNSNRSLLDADIVIFKPYTNYENYTSRSYKGKPRLSETDSFEVAKDAAHWRSELQSAYHMGKTILVYLPKFKEYFVENGEKGVSSTSKTKEVTYVFPFHNYLFFPVEFDKITPSRGKSIKFTKDVKFLASYWKEYEAISNYEVILDGRFVPNSAILVTKTGDKVVGLHLNNGKGNMIFLPDLVYSNDEFSSLEEDDEGNMFYVWTPRAIRFGKTLISHIVEIDKSLQGNRDASPTPQWANSDEYRLPNELIFEKEIQSINFRIEELEKNRIIASEKLEEEGKLRFLLYETGHNLENSILKALKLMRFRAESYKDSESEFDAVFLSPEGRFLGEAEGKENSAINIDKLSQLERNLQEDFQKNDVHEYANGVLFGNAYRLQKPSERHDFFTEKCLTGAKRAAISLIRTSDLFEIARYLQENDDSLFAQKCREAIIAYKGQVVVFPKPPVEHTTSPDEVKD